MANMKKIMVKISKGVHCPSCRDEMRMSANHDVLRCFNPACEQYMKHFELPEVEIKLRDK